MNKTIDTVKLEAAVDRYREFLLSRKINPIESIDDLRIWLDSEREFLENGLIRKKQTNVQMGKCSRTY
jgi:hypothetical protein